MYREQEFLTYFYTLYRHWGCQNWWPARSRFEVIVGAYLTQNTSWTNVERALDGLRTNGCLSVDALRALPLSRLEKLIRPSGYFRQKARRLKSFIRYIDESYGGSLSRMFAQPTDRLRAELLGLDGVGPETADSILLYAGQHPLFVVDAYTRRILERHGLAAATASYEDLRALCERELNCAAVESALEHPYPRETRPADRLRGAPGACHLPSRMSLAKRSPLVQVYNDMHGLIVGVGKNYCFKSQPKCDECPLRIFLPIVK